MRIRLLPLLILIAGGLVIGGCWPFSTIGHPEEVFWDDYPNFREVMPGDPPPATRNPPPWRTGRTPTSQPAGQPGPATPAAAGELP
jgi:hypothetical protein